jgi:hypothetical protein
MSAELAAVAPQMAAEVLGPALGFIGGSKDRKEGRRQFDLNFWLARRQDDFQRSAYQQQANRSVLESDRNFQFAQDQFKEQQFLSRHGIQTKINDAKQAGIHPLAALGQPLAGGSPVNISGNSGPALPDGGKGAIPTSGATEMMMGQALGQALGGIIDIAREKGKEDAGIKINEMWSVYDVGDGSYQLLPADQLMDPASESTTLKTLLYAAGRDAMKKGTKIRQAIKQKLGFEFDVNALGRIRPKTTKQPNKIKRKSIPIGSAGLR